MKTRAIRFRYRNHRGETAIRTIMPVCIWWGSTQWHPEEQWLLDGEDLDRRESRSFALRDCDFTTTELTLALTDELAREVVGNELWPILRDHYTSPGRLKDAVISWHLLALASAASNGDILANAASGEAFRNLVDHQRQLDADGIEVGVSRQALDEVLDSFRHLIWRRDDLLTANNRYLERARAAEAPMDRLELAKAIYAAQGHEECDPWDQAVERANRLGILQDNPGFLNSNQQNAMAAADAAIAFAAAGR
jgi:hypothetical protein